MRPCLYLGIRAGAIMVLVALIDVVRNEIMQPEKAAYFFIGHWFDAFWSLRD